MRRWAWLLLLVAGLVLFEAVRRVLVVTQNPNLVPALLLLGATVVPTSFVAFVYGRKLAFGISSGAVALVALVGGVVGVVAAGTLEFDAMRQLGALPMLGVGLIEESAKLIAPIVVLVLTRHRAAADGLLVGVASGAGFAALETMGYGFVVLVRSGGNVAAVDDVLLLRGVLSPAAHMAWTGITAAALWYAAEHRFSGRSVVRFVVAFVAAVVLHAVWDTAGSPVVYAILAVVGLGALTWLAHRLPHQLRNRSRSAVPA